MIYRPISTRRRMLLGVCSVAFLLGCYTWFSDYRQERAKIVRHDPNAIDKTVPTWSMIAHGAFKVWDEYQGETYPPAIKARISKQRWIVADVTATVWRFFVGMLCGVTIAFFLGLFMGCFHTVDALCNPIVTMLAKIPPPALMAVFFLFAGLDTGLYVTIIAFGVAPQLAMGVSRSIQEFPQQLVVKAKTLGASTVEIIWDIVIPYTMPKLLTEARTQISGAIVFLLCAEMAMGDRGIGFRINNQRRLYNMDVVFIYIAISAMATTLLDYSFRFAQAKLYPWYTKGR